jgi:tetratricopeptide (TPR) repeat protein
MTTVAEALAWAVQAHQAGRWQQAETLYRHVLRADPVNAGALHLLGVLAFQFGQHEQALDYIRQAIVIRPQDASFHSNQGLVLDALHRSDEAVASYREALRLRPNFAEAHNNLGNALQRLGRPEEAVASIQEALRLRPDFHEAHTNLGNVLLNQGRLDEAVSRFREALRLCPNSYEAQSNLATAQQSQGRLEEAVASFQEALRLRPDSHEAHFYLGNALQLQWRLDEAALCFREALCLQPDYPEAYNSLGNVLKEQGRTNEAMTAFGEALRLRPDFAEAHFHLGLTLLSIGRLEQGWTEYEWRRRCLGFQDRSFRQPLWDGAPLGGQPILLYAEQGIGDTLQFVRYAPLVQQRGGSVVLECPPVLVPLLATGPGIDHLVAQGSELPEFATQASLLSLPGILGTTLATIPARVPYIQADPRRRERWQQELQGANAFNIGIAWQGNPLHPHDRIRSVRLEQFAPLAQLPGVRLVRLQRGPGSEQLAQLKEWAVLDPENWPEDPAEAWQETAALISALDIVVTVDTALAHLAGAMAMPVWVALPLVPDWRWLLDHEDSPWYPQMRLFRQEHPGDWCGVFARIAEAIGTMNLTCGRRKR